MALLNIISVTKNDLEGIISTIESTKCLRSQPHVKHIIIDSSTNNIKSDVRSFVKSNENVEYIWQDACGIAAAFNLGLSHSTAKWVWFLNGGDRIHIDLKIDHILYILNESRADAIIFQNEFDGLKKVYKHPPMWDMWPPLYSWIPHPATFTRRRLYEQFGTFDESFGIAMDYEFWIRCFSKQVTVDTISIPLTIFNRNGISSTNPQKTAYEVLRAIKKHFWIILRIWFNNGLLIFRAWYTYSKIRRKPPMSR